MNEAYYLPTKPALPKVEIISVKELLDHLDCKFTWEQLKTLRRRHELFTRSIPLGRITSKKGGAARYIPKESVKYLREILRLKRLGKSYSEIKRILKKETNHLRILRNKAAGQQVHINAQAMCSTIKAIVSIEERARKLNITAFRQPPHKVYEKLCWKYECEKDPVKRNELKLLIYHFARYLRAILKSSKMSK